jgi:steroid 5-alpha reductase family enzyme
MKKAEAISVVSIPVVVVFAILMGIAGSRHGLLSGNVPVFGLAVALAFLINWLAFIPAYFLRTEKFYDLTGSFTYIALVSMSLWLSSNAGWRSVLVFSLVTIWALRLGSFLFRRVRRAGRDGRFDEIKQSFWRFLLAWTMQGLWVVFTVAPALIVITSSTRPAPGIVSAAGLILWIFGFTVEVTADAQKSRFRANPQNKDRFISSGLWSRSRHPNYFGEIVVWTGIALIALPVMVGWQYVALISPVFVTLLLTRISGIPILEERADKKWSGQPAYESYKKSTPILIPRLLKKKIK